jgi:hypothetical protein
VSALIQCWWFACRWRLSDVVGLPCTIDWLRSLHEIPESLEACDYLLAVPMKGRCYRPRFEKQSVVVDMHRPFVVDVGVAVVVVVVVAAAETFDIRIAAVATVAMDEAHHMMSVVWMVGELGHWQRAWQRGSAQMNAYPLGLTTVADVLVVGDAYASMMAVLLLKEVVVVVEVVGDGIGVGMGVGGASDESHEEEEEHIGVLQAMDRWGWLATEQVGTSMMEDTTMKQTP